MEMSSENLVAQIMELQALVQSLQAQVHAQAQVQAPVIQYVVADPIVTPERFSGNQRFPLSSFKLAVERVFNSAGPRFPDDKSKINYIGNLLDGLARRWLDTVQLSSSEESRQILSNLAVFWESMSKHFGSKDTRLQTEIKLVRFRQGKLSATEFAIRFKQLAATVEFNERALIAIFISNLNVDVVEFLRRQSAPERLEDLVNVCNRFDYDYLDLGLKGFRAPLPVA